MSEQLDLFTGPEKITAETPQQSSSEVRILFFDLETQKEAKEVGGWGNIHQMLLTVGVVWDSLEKKFSTYLEEDVAREVEAHGGISYETQAGAGRLVDRLRGADLVIGFNVSEFDYRVLQPYASRMENPFDLHEIRTFDMLLDIKQRLGFRLSLNHLAQHTLLTQKEGKDGLYALDLYRKRQFDKLISYCQKDVEVTRDLFLYGESNGYVKYQTRSGTIKKVEVDWKTANLI